MSGDLSDSSALSQTMDTMTPPQSSQSPLPGSGSTNDTVFYHETAEASNWEPTGDDQPETVQPLLQTPYIAECALADQRPLDAQTPQSQPHWYTLHLDEQYKMILPPPTSSKLTGLQIHGVWYTMEGRKLGQDEREPAASFSGQGMSITSWTLGSSGYCANFSLDLQRLATDGSSQDGGPDQYLRINSALGSSVLNTTGLLLWNITAIFSQSAASSPNLSTLQSGTPPSSDAGSTESGTPLDSSTSPASRSSNKVNVIVPAVVVPVVVILTAGVIFFLWRRHRRSRMAPSAAFRADHSEAIAAAERRGAVGLGGTGTPLSPSPAPYFPLDEKRAFTP